MSAAHSTSQSVRRSAAAPAPRTSAVPQAAPQRSRAAASNEFSFASAGEEKIKVNLSDVPFTRPALEEDVFKPTLLSRLFDLISPNR